MQLRDWTDARLARAADRSHSGRSNCAAGRAHQVDVGFVAGSASYSVAVAGCAMCCSTSGDRASRPVRVPARRSGCSSSCSNGEFCPHPLHRRSLFPPSCLKLSLFLQARRALSALWLFVRCVRWPCGHFGLSMSEPQPGESHDERSFDYGRTGGGLRLRVRREDLRVTSYPMPQPSIAVSTGFGASDAIKVKHPRDDTSRRGGTRAAGGADLSVEQERAQASGCAPTSTSWTSAACW